MESPQSMTLWEAQFGDFHNGAQIIIDTYVSCGETKWLRSSGLTLLLPHGYDGAGPEYSSARVERFLQMCDGDPFSTEHKPVNMIVANCTTPANYFHLLRRQMLRPYRRPLVVISPKTLLRHNKALSSLAELGPSSRFQPVFSDAATRDVKTLVFVSGKLYYELLEEQAKRQRTDLAYVRLEELSPFPFDMVRQHLSTFKKNASVQRVVWCQEEPVNMGAYSFVAPRLSNLLKEQRLPSLEYVGRPALPLPAVGSGVWHKKQIDAFMNALFK